MAEIPAPKDVGGPAAAPAQPFTRYREWPPAKACGAAPLIDRADLRVQRLDGVGYQPGVAVAHPVHFPAACECGAGGSAHGGVHAGGVAAAGEDGYAFYRLHGH